MLFSVPEPVQARTLTPANAPHMVVLAASESAGPHPLLEILDNQALQRWDITEGRDGVPVTLSMQLIDLDNQGSAICGAEVYLRHGGDTSAANVRPALQGVQCTNGAGRVTFKTLYPGSAPGQQKLQMQVLLPNTVPSSRTITSASTQLRFPQDRYEPLWALQRAPAHETLSMNGSVRAGFFASILIGITTSAEV